MTTETVCACLMGMDIFPIAIPWTYVIENYVRRPADRWGPMPGTTPVIGRR